MGIVAGRAVGVPGAVGIIGNPVKARELRGLVAARAGGGRGHATAMRFVAGGTFAMALRARGLELTVTAGAAHWVAEGVRGALVTGRAARMVGDSTGEPGLRRMAVHAE